MVDDFVAALQMPGADREIALDAMAEHLPESMAAFTKIERAVNILRGDVIKRAAEKEKQ